MKEPKSRSRATLDHPTAATGRDGAIDFAATVEAASAERVMLDMPPDELEAIGAWIKSQPAPRPSRAVKQALAGVQAPQQRSKEAASKAREMAGRELDRLGDASLPADERERRKRRLTKGPSEFREMRGDLPKPKR